MKQVDISTVRAHFRHVDPVLFRVLDSMPLEPLIAKEKPQGYFEKLCREIVSQQLAGRAAEAIHTRFLSLFPKKQPTPEGVFGHTEAQLRAVGMSWAKARYLRNLAEAIISKKVDLKNLPIRSDDAVVVELTKIKGIGRWTAEMFLIFTLGRPDVFSLGDAGLRRGLEKLYGKKRVNTVKKIERLATRWSPWRSFASLALWHVIDTDQNKL